MLGRSNRRGHTALNLQKILKNLIAIAVLFAIGTLASCQFATAEDEATYMMDSYDTGDKTIDFKKYKTEHGERGYRESLCSTDLEDLENSPTYGPVHYTCLTTRLARLPNDEIRKFMARSCRVGSDVNMARFKASAENQSAIFSMEMATVQNLGATGQIFKTVREQERCVRLPDGPDKAQTTKGSTPSAQQKSSPTVKYTSPVKKNPSVNPPTVATFIMHNRDRYRIGLEFYSRTRSNHVWPGGDQQYNLSRDQTYNLTCRPGEKICFGAWRDYQNL
jgi:hypothetical protein